MKARHAAAVALALASGYLAVLIGARRWHQPWGATDEEIARPLPGDDLIPDPKLDSTQAITVRAAAERIWPWLAQAGYGGRAGFYASTTRLLTRMRITYQPTAKWAPYVHLLLEPGHFVRGRRQLLGLRQRAQASSAAA